MDLGVFYLICGYEMVLDLGFLEIGDLELLCLISGYGLKICV